jgi:outer membrane protein OmpA-like peptidoglycan-associated protein
VFKFLVGFAVFLVWATWARHVYVCEIRHLCSQEVIFDPAVSGLRIGPTGEVISGRGQMAFTLANGSADLTPANRDFMRRLGRYLQSDDKLRLRIVGRYTQAEKAVPAGMYENLGLARAAFVRDSLVRWQQVRPGRVWIEAQIAEDSDPEAATAPDEPVSFWFAPNTAQPPPRYEFAHMTFSEVHFKGRQAIFTPRLPFIIYADSLKAFARQQPTTVTVTAYTSDRIPPRQAQARAEAVRKYLLRTKDIAAEIATNTRPADARNRTNSLLIEVK